MDILGKFKSVLLEKKERRGKIVERLLAQDLITPEEATVLLECLMTVKFGDVSVSSGATVAAGSIEKSSCAVNWPIGSDKDVVSNIHLAWRELREKNQNIPDDVIDFMRDIALWRIYTAE